LGNNICHFFPAAIVHVAAELGHTELLAYVAQLGGVRLNETDKRGRTAMHMAVQMAQQQCMFLLLELGGLDLAEQADNEGLTPLQLAAKMANIQVRIGPLLSL
jgi:ankyrin repeat protein